jgi:hypothetical protein
MALDMVGIPVSPGAPSAGSAWQDEQLTGVLAARFVA